MLYLVSAGRTPANALESSMPDPMEVFQMLDRNLLRLAKEALEKEAFAPLTPEAMAAAQGPPPPMPPQGGGMPPMDPSMMGGMPPQGGMPPMDPSMMGGGGMPPMDPSMMGGMPSQGGMPPMDPSMMGGMPPPPPGGDMGGGQPVMLSMDDLQSILEQASDHKGDHGKASNAEIMDRLDEIEGMLSDALGLGDTASEAGEAMGAPASPAGPEDIAALMGAAQGQGMPPEAGMPPMPPEAGMPPPPPPGPFGSPEALQGAAAPPPGITASASASNPIMSLVRQLR